jgi:hypothetical protein
MGAGREIEVSLDGVRDKNVMQLKKLNTAIFPVRYNDKYYSDALTSGDFSKLGFISPLPVNPYFPLSFAGFHSLRFDLSEVNSLFLSFCWFCLFQVFYRSLDFNGSLYKHNLVNPFGCRVFY